MKILTCSLLALGVLSATPVLAAGVYLGPGGVGVDIGHDRGYRDYDRDRDRDRPYYRDDEGRSAYRDRAYRHNRDYDDN